MATPKLIHPNYASSMSLRVIVPPHPLVAHWLTVLRDKNTPPPLFASAMKELGRWLSYEAIRDWLPQQAVQVETPHSSCDGFVIDPTAALLVVPLLTTGLGLWAGGQEVLPNARVAHLGFSDQGTTYLNCLPNQIGERVGVVVFDAVLASGSNLIKVLSALDEKSVRGEQVRAICAVAAAPGLRQVAEQFPNLSIYTACIDAELDDNNCVVPGLGNANHRLYGTATDDFLG